MNDRLNESTAKRELTPAEWEQWQRATAPTLRNLAAALPKVLAHAQTASAADSRQADTAKLPRN